MMGFGNTNDSKMMKVTANAALYDLGPTASRPPMACAVMGTAIRAPCFIDVILAVVTCCASKAKSEHLRTHGL